MALIDRRFFLAERPNSDSAAFELRHFHLVDLAHGIEVENTAAALAAASLVVFKGEVLTFRPGTLLGF